jgi:Flp pilus assembly protein TadD
MAAAPVLRRAPVDEALADVDPTVPSPPGATCTTSEPLRGESRRHADLGDQAGMTGDPAGAAAEYRAAITMDNCNPAAWASLGGLVLKAGHPGSAVDAFRVVNRLQPQHYGAWASLGAAYEALGQRDLARDAYQRALSLKPGLPDAVTGLARVGGTAAP